MAMVKKIQKVAPKVAHKVAPVASKVSSKSPIDLIEGAEVINMEGSGIEFLGKEGGRQASPEVEALKEKVSALKIGQGFVIPKALRIEREVTNSTTGTSSTIYTYKGANTISKLANREGKRFRTKRSTDGKMYIFRVTPLEVAPVESDESEEGEE